MLGHMKFMKRWVFMKCVPNSEEEKLGHSIQKIFLNSAILLNSGCFPWIYRELSSEFAPGSVY